MTESYNARIKRRRDLFHFLDLIALNTKYLGVLGIQTTTASNLSARIKKAEGLPAYYLWLACGNDVEFHGWKKVKGRWEPKIVKVSTRELFS